MKADTDHKVTPAIGAGSTVTTDCDVLSATPSFPLHLADMADDSGLSGGNNGMSSAVALPVRQSELFAVRREMPYTPAERKYSQMVQDTLQDLLEATSREVVLMRRYHHDDRLAMLPAGKGVDRSGLRRVMVERILSATLEFVRDASPGGPIFQRETRSGLTETQLFGTRYPHIVIEREDAYSQADSEPIYTEWRLRRTQNQKAETHMNRWLDAADLGVNLVKAVAGVV